MTDTIRWDRFDTKLGPVYAASSERGLCRLTWLVSGDREFEDGLARQRADDRIVRESGSQAALASQLRAYLDSKRQEPNVQLDLSRSTAFERSVLEATRAIPYGTTITYGQLARRIGRPGAARAVGNALRANPLPLIIPCHRVIRADGTPGGYAGPNGTPKKIRLLRLESRQLLP